MNKKIMKMITELIKHIDNYELLQDIIQELHFQWILNQNRQQKINEYGNPQMAAKYLAGRLIRFINKERNHGISMRGTPKHLQPKIEISNYGLNPEPLFHIQTKKHKPQP